jgi:hypothetical protein
MVRKAVWLLALCALSGSGFACGADDDDMTPMGGASGGGGGGVSGGTAGSSGANAGSSGANAGSSGASAGSSGASAGSSGASAGSSGASAGSSGASGMDFVPGSPTFKAIFKEVFTDTGCNGGAFCHGSGSVTGGLDMTERDKTYMLLVGVDAAAMSLPTTMPVPPHCKESGKKRVVAGNPDMSLLVEKMEKAMPSCGTLMPPSGMIAAAKIQQVRTWIMNGAMNN